jgi:rRNA maturation protein Rpf1
MSLNELISKISQENSLAALVISSFKGNPGNLQFLFPDGSTQYELRLESAALRREVASDVRNRIDNISRIVLLDQPGEKLKNFAEFLSSLFLIPLDTYSNSEEIPSGGSNQAYILLRESRKKIHWSWHLAANHIELGPRLRITHLRSKPNDEEQD